jgi:hypothetical protein
VKTIRSLLEVLAMLEPIEEEFPPIDDLRPEPVELSFDGGAMREHEKKSEEE